ncbi:preprotein translocase subunit SecE [Candidatus Kuenenbacteria bacterium CG_4_9_14_3_um_filter_39_14]|uniref:Protein translocase subunit SecE n=7 Tax=Candidatus Kueneniibacteriota TaxID=1752740 RepID=A0A2M7IM80_9BACT|nr:preprotein translocase subunit SecE [Candidatus Kuenenbacteria bacterium]PIP29187.1 MAG: preprotein translocase subunit SecE [Candidatus Kuenenbacteria bacterium CG23_combo_of_CG06-09_8_20_14_all_39_39]PIP75737.1 MAG: preprotein translocase subunit SecE [Candidatus Kuenenbacteria bacterium CG22_combo_CG10-13_8_21_14_all_39_9]PIR80704.1 MAG: preprotein translocase subunit SecE [Candidatus Kuenenbacteria bacterium CG10_big_fil_rev_8_21_14_0_10_39_14]PIW95946.1 MAG: preprotein translocase subun
MSKKMPNKLVQYVKDSRTELKKVIWPTRKQATNDTLLVIGFSLGVAAFLGLVDFVLTKLLELVI